MAFDLDKELVLHKIGKGYLETVTGKFNEIIKGQKFKFDVKATLVDVEGGDSLFPIYTFISKKEGTVEIDSAVFSLAQSSIGQKVVITTTGLKKMNRILGTLATTTLGATLTGVTDVKCIAPDGTMLVVTQTGTADAAGVDVSETGAVKWGTNVTTAGEYTFWFKSDAPTESASMGMLKNEMPEVCSLVWSIEGAELDGDKYQVDIYAKRVRADGAFTIDAARSTATVPKLSLKILDPGDGTDDFATIVVSKIA
jgi:hypothetical protein